MGKVELYFVKWRKRYCELRLALRQTNFRVKMDVEIKDLEYDRLLSNYWDGKPTESLPMTQDPT